MVILIWRFKFVFFDLPFEGVLLAPATAAAVASLPDPETSA